MVQTNKETNTLITIFEQANKQTNKKTNKDKSLTWTVSMETVISYAFFVFKSRQIQDKPKCHTINYLLTELARDVLGNIGPRSFLYGTRCTRSVLSRPQANIPVRPSRSVSKRLLVNRTIIILFMYSFTKYLSRYRPTNRYGFEHVICSWASG